MISPRLIQVKERWARLTDQSIGEAQQTIHDLLAVVEEAEKLASAGDERHKSCLSECVLCDALARWYTAVEPPARCGCLDGVRGQGCYDYHPKEERR